MVTNENTLKLIRLARLISDGLSKDDIFRFKFTEEELESLKAKPDKKSMERNRRRELGKAMNLLSLIVKDVDIDSEGCDKVCSAVFDFKTLSQYLTIVDLSADEMLNTKRAYKELHVAAIRKKYTKEK